MPTALEGHLAGSVVAAVGAPKGFESVPLAGLASASSSAASEVDWGPLFGRLLREQRYGPGVVVDAAVSTPTTRDIGSCASPSTRDFGTNARGSYAAPLLLRLDALAPSGDSASAVDITVGAYLILMDSVLSLDQPNQYLLPSGTRCRVHRLDDDGDFWIEVPSALDQCHGRALCIDMAHVGDFQLLVASPPASGR